MTITNEALTEFHMEFDYKLTHSLHLQIFVVNCNEFMLSGPLFTAALRNILQQVDY
jgi:hypothetical protein